MKRSNFGEEATTEPVKARGQSYSHEVFLEYTSITKDSAFASHHSYAHEVCFKVRCRDPRLCPPFALCNHRQPSLPR